MSIEAITWALEHAQIPTPTPAGMPSAPALTVVLLGLANHASRDGTGAYPSVRTLARYARMSERQVQRCLVALVELGLIVRGDQGHMAIIREDRRPVSYDLRLGRGDHSSPRRSARGDNRARHGVTTRPPRGDTDVTRTVPEPKSEPPAAAASAPSQIDRLAAACRRVGLTARFDTLTR